MKNFGIKNRIKNGFTMVEMLAVVAVIALLATFAIEGIVIAGKNIRQAGLDKDAQLIYDAVQNRMTELRADGREDVFRPGDDNGIELLSYNPSDNLNYQEDISLCYLQSVLQSPIVSDVSTINAILPVGSVDDELRNGYWYVEYSSESGSVYSVFYSNKEAIPTDSESLNSLRDKANRLSGGSVYGYYGGDAVGLDSIDRLQPTLTIENGEQLIAHVKCVSFVRPNFTFTVSDGINTYTMSAPSNDVTSSSAAVWEYTWIMDSLSSTSSRFENQCPGIIPGAQIKVTVVASSNDSSLISGSDSKNTNGLFGDSSSEDIAYIECGRHLQNLDLSSGVITSITKAEIKCDIDFASDDGWNDIYDNLYFEPITNSNILSVNADLNKSSDKAKIIKNIRINTSGYAGIFDEFDGTEISKLYVVDADVIGNAGVGVFAGKTVKNISINDCRVYLSKNGSLIDALKKDTEEEVYSSANVLGGVNTGAFIGSSVGNVEIKNSLASAVICGNGNVGGFVGYANSGLSVSGCYTDSYIKGTNAGGISGGGDISVSKSYTAGFINGSSISAGFGCGNADLKNCYTAVSFEGKGTSYSTAKTGACQGTVYYIEPGINLAGSVKISADDLHEMDLSSLGFTSSVKTSAYNLVNGMALQSYPFAGFADMRHYGDWNESFVSGNLVYFEKYTDGTYGFYGSGLNALKDMIVTSDGYAVVYNAGGNVPDSIEVKYDGKTVSAKQKVDSTYDGKSYTLVLIDSDIYVYDDEFYQKIELLGCTYYFNPLFAKTIFAVSEEPENGETVYIRSARQFNNLSKYYNNYYSKYSRIMSSFVFSQEENIDYASYDWASCNDTVITYQEPVSDKSHPFSGRYKGNSHYISDFSVLCKNDSNYIGTFGYVTGVIQDLYIVSEYSSSEFISSGSALLTTVASTKSLYMGTLAGFNSGVISNCAVAGYSMNIQTNGRSYIGGLIGMNSGIVTYSSAETSLIKVETNYAPETYVAGFVGYNQSNINHCYSIGLIDIVKNDNGVTIVSGFDSANSSYITECYSAVAVTASGISDTYGFAPSGSGYDSCYYLNKGIYSFIGNIYTYQSADSSDAGTAITYSKLKTKATTDGFVSENSVFCGNTTASDYPFSTYVNVSGEQTHFGDWPEEATLGAGGIFYWEVETGGANAGVHISYQDTSGKYSGSSLCTAHDDGGIITSYGYGYYAKNDTKNFSMTYSNVANNFNFRQDVTKELTKYLPGYTYISYESATPSDSSSGTYVTGTSANAKMNITTTEGTRDFIFNPLFGDSISVLSDGNEVAPGTSQNPYKIRSVNQLQFINWNSAKKNAVTSITSTTDTSNSAYTYLKYVSGNDADTSGINYYWQQSHNVNANGASFTPIGSLYDADSSNSDNSNVYMAYFSGDYDGNSYSISNVEIYSNNQCVGLFGVTADANLHEIVLYSDMGNSITEGSDGSNWYCLGGLVGFAAQGNSSTSKLTNCTVSGYTIKDSRGTNNGGYGGANIGGMIGATNMDISGCSAVTDIVIDFKYNDDHKNVRVGGLVGSVRATISNSYVGGSVTVTKKDVDGGNIIENIFTDFYDRNTCIWIGGISGGVYLRNSGNLASLVGPIDQMTKIINCYSYMDLPETDFKNYLIRAVQSIAANGELQTREFEVNTNSKANEILNPKIEIYNSYVLLANNSLTDDAKLYSETYGSSAMWEVDMRSERMKEEKISSNKDNTDRGIWIFNSYSPYLSYAQMSDLVSSDGLLYKLSQGPVSSTFSSVTTVENGLNVSGKYSFPGNDTSLSGRDYPFPTVLTRKTETGTVNVHYGSWPKVGIFADVTSLSMDLISDYDTTNETTSKTVNLELSGMNTSSEPIVTISDESIVSVAVEKTDSTNYKLIVTGKNIGSTDVKVSYVSDGVTYTIEFSVEVTAKVNISSSLVDVNVGETIAETVKATDSKGNDLKVDWTYEVVNIASNSYCSVTPTNTKNSATDTVNITGLVHGEGQIKVTGSVNVGEKTFEGIGYISVTVYRADCFGLVDLSSSTSTINEVPITSDGTVFNGTNRVYEDDGPSYDKGTVYLYCTGRNLDFSKWNVTSVIIDGVDYYNHDPDIFYIQLGSKNINEKEYSYLPITIISAELSKAENVKVTVSDGSRTVNLSVPFTTQSSATIATVTFNANTGTGTMEKEKFVYGTPKKLTANAFTKQYYILSSWNTKADGSGVSYSDEQVITYLPKSVTLYAQWIKKPCTIVVDEAYSGGGYSSTVIEAGTSYTLPTPSRKGYSFEGWICDGVTYAAGQTITLSDSMTFTAQWNKYTYVITFVHGEHGSGDSYTQTFTIDDYSTATLLPNKFKGSWNWKDFDHWEPSGYDNDFDNQAPVSQIIDFMYNNGLQNTITLEANWEYGVF